MLLSRARRRTDGVAAAAGLLANPVIGLLLYTLKTTGCGLPPGSGLSIGAAEAVSHLVVAGIVGWSLYTEVRTGSGLRAGLYGFPGAGEGLSHLTVLAIIVVLVLQFFEKGSSSSHSRATGALVEATLSCLFGLAS